MEFSRKNVQELFSAGNRYQVPEYQRGYAWKSLQIEDYWKDVQESTTNDQLYLGTLILQKSANDPNSDLFLIVDGQQRITTICLLLLAARNIAIEKKWPQASTLPQLIAFQNIARGETMDLRVEVGKNIKSSYEYLVQNPEWSGANFPSNIDGRKARTLKKNYLFFRNQLNNFSQEQLSDLLTKVLSNTFFLVVKVGEALQAFDIFERTNARGVSLNVSDLLKNRLFANADEIPGLTDRWDAIVKNSESTLPKVLKYFDTLRNGHDTGKSVLFSHLRETTKNLGPEVFLRQFEVFSRFMNSVIESKFTRENRIDQVFNGEENGEEYSFDFMYGDEIFFKRVKRSLDALAFFRVYVSFPVIYSGLLAIKRFSVSASSQQLAGLKKEYLKMLNTIECFHFVNNAVCTIPTNKPERAYAVAAMEIFSAPTTALCKEQFDAIRTELQEIKIADKGQFEESFIDITYSPTENKALVAYIFDRINEGPFERVPSVNIFDPQSETIINRTYEVEHIAPISTWQGDEDVLNNIGNLLILRMSTNRKVSNFELPKKISIMKECNFDSLRPVQEFVSWVETQSVTSMGAEEIKNRAKKLATKAYEVWNPWPQE